ncbi:NAD(P)/FAD-dependent oxidoreductase [Leptothrix discophora]|uniref:FAD-dependent oxidoreductase n=1 Tax=Leptothrix discophora TaxID=89 RepID=A0ABT9G3D9_LEPDI|nr:FAD-dependent oxidoreductase [Leptothrix discophora]MDP4301006.1 FAD-dependent oxidoreductase [Leptothrix discophora]
MHNSQEAAMVIVGAGHVGGRTAQHLREAGWTGEIVLIGAEPALPYERPPLSKGVLTGAQTLAQTAILTPEACDAARITHWTGTVSAIHPMARQVSLSDGRSLAYRALLLATGGHARALSIPGADHPAVQALRTQTDAVALAPRLRPGAHVVLVGGGFIGLEVAASALAMGCRVTLLEGAPRLMGRAVPASVAERVLALHRRHGVDVRLGVVPRAFEAQGDGLTVHLTAGEPLQADAVVVGIGIEPATELARAAGLRTDRGIVVDRRLATSAAGVYAAGDVAEFPSPLSGLPIRQETWHNAETQARVAALNMLGGDETHASTAWFWSDQFDWQLQVSGEPALGVTTVQRPLADADAELNLYLDADGRIVGVSGCGPTSAVAKELKLARTLVERGVRSNAQTLADPAVKLKSLLSA